MLGRPGDGKCFVCSDRSKAICRKAPREPRADVLDSSDLSYRGQMSSVWWLRWLMVVIGALIGLVLVSSHHMIIGVLILAMATVRAAVLVTARKRRAALRASRASRFGAPRY